MRQSDSASVQKFFEAIKVGGLAEVESLLRSDPGLASTRNDAGVSALLLAIYYRQEAVKNLLLAVRPQVDIHEAAAAGLADRLATLLAEDPGLANAFAPDGFTPLGLAAFFGQAEVVDLLLQRGADVNAVAQNATRYTALTGAVARGDAKIVATLLAHGANPKHRYGPGYTPLHEAAASGKTEIVAVLLKYGADANACTDEGQTPLALALERGQQATAEILRQYGSNA